MIEIRIAAQEANQRVDKYVRKYLNNAPLSFIYRLFRKKDIKINGHWVDIAYILKADDVLRIYATDQQIKELAQPRKISAAPQLNSIVYEDNNILIADKDKGLLVNGEEDDKSYTLADQVISYLIAKGEYDPEATKGFIPAPAHRLDRNTSGLVVFAKNLPALQELEEMFKSRQGIDKRYLALVVGNVTNDQIIDLPLRKDAEAKLVKVDKLANGALEAKTEIHVRERYGKYTLLDVHLLTGRTHQIRVHMQAIGHPVVGDAKYGDFKENRVFKDRFKYDSQFLHAFLLSFALKDGLLRYLDGRIFESPLPEKEKAVIDIIKKENGK